MRLRQRRRLFLALLGAPATLYVLAVGGVPILRGVFYSLFAYNLQRPWQRHFVGLGNYADLWRDPATRQALGNTVLFTVGAVGIELVAGMALALLLWRDDRFNRAALALMLVPVTLTPLAVGLMFRALLNADFGLIGYYARIWRISGPHGFLADPATALPTLIAIDVWEWTPLMALLLTAGLRAIPADTLDAAAIDGARGWRLLRLVLLPMLLPTILLALLLRGMDAFRVFDSVFATTQGGPGEATSTLMFRAVKIGLTFFDIGAGAAIANLMIVCIAAATAVLVVLMRRADARLS